MDPMLHLEHHVCPIPRTTFTTFMDEGRMHYKARRFRKALFCFDRALELQPESKVALVSRSQCHLRLGDAELALQDAQASFDIDGNFINGLYQYAEALFNLGQFEQALVAYHRGLTTRRDKEEFRVGIAKCKGAIMTAIGERHPTQIEDLDEMLPKLEEMEAEEKGAKKHCCVMDKSEDIEARKGMKQTKKNISKARARWVDRDVLGVLHKDKDYLTKFLKRPDIVSDNQSGSETLRGSATEALKYLKIREQFWHQQNPMYARKVGLNFNNDMVLQYEAQEQEKVEASRKIKMDAAQGAVLKNLAQINHALQIGRAKDCQLECERALRQIKEISNRLLPRKPEFTTEILHYKGQALLKLKNFEGAVATFQEEFNVASANKMTDVKSRALDFLGRSYAMKGSFSEAAEVWDSRLSIAKSSVERAYLFHEIGRCYYETNKNDLAKMYAQQSMDEALKIADDVWCMNASILLGQCEIKVKAFEKALEHFEKAAEYGIACGNKGNVQLLKEGEHCIRIYLEKQKSKGDNEVNIIKDEDSDDSFDENMGEGVPPLLV